MNPSLAQGAVAKGPMSTSKLKGIILATDSFYPIVDGVVRIVEELHTHYLSQYIPSYIVCGSYPRYMEKHPNVIRITSLPVPGSYRFALPLLISQKLSHIDPSTISVVHAHAPFFMTHSLLSWARKHKKPVVLTFHSKYLEKFKNSPRFLRWLTPAAYLYTIFVANQCDIITTPTHSYRKILINHGIQSSKFHVVPHGVPSIPSVNPDTQKFKSDPILKKIRDEKSHGNHILLYVGQLIKEKNPDLLVMALAELSKKNFPFFCVMVGTGDQHQKLQKLIQKLKLSSTILFTHRIGDREILHQIYDQADLFTFPSTYETQGLVVLEAAQHGVPTVGIRGATGISDFVIHKKTGYLTPQTPEAFATGIVDALSNPSLYKKVCESAKKTIPVSCEDMISGFESIYAKVCP